MKISLNNSDLEKLENLFETRNLNIEISEILNSICFNRETFLDESFIDKNEKDLNKFFIKFLGFENSIDKKVYERFLSSSFSFSSPNLYKENPYFKNIKIENFKYKNYELQNDFYDQFEFFPLNEIEIFPLDFYREKSFISCFKEKFSFISLSKNNQIWMSITPNEINTMEPYIKKAKGNVLTFGLGLGYFPYMCSLKSDVKKITIIEKDINIINIFKEKILPQFINKNKIEIIQNDAFDFLKSKGIKDFDFCFVDIYHNAEDGLPIYMKFLKETKSDPKIFYWLEESMIELLRRCFLILFEEQLKKFDDKNYVKSKNIFDEIINDLYFQTKDLKFTSFDQILNFLSKDNLKKFCLNDGGRNEN